MIKVIAAVVCAFAAMLMIILSVSTTYWLQWQIASDGRNMTHYRGLFKHCWESRNNVTNELETGDGRTGCEGEFAHFKADWNGVTIAFMILGLLLHLAAFCFAIVAGCRKGHPFPSFWVAGLFLFAAIMVIIALLVYTFHNWLSDVFFSWSYGGGWSTVALSIIALVLIMADR